MRQPRRSQACDGKEPIDSKEEAQGKARRLQAQTGSWRTNAYKCRFCKKWHVGRTQRRKP